jgi:hypothetical protein
LTLGSTTIEPNLSQTPGITFFVYQELLDFLENWLNIPGASNFTGNAAKWHQLNLPSIVTQGSYNGVSFIAGDFLVKPNRLELP